MLMPLMHMNASMNNKCGSEKKNTKIIFLSDNRRIVHDDGNSKKRRKAHFCLVRPRAWIELLLNNSAEINRPAFG